MEEDGRTRGHPGQRAAGQLTRTPLEALADAYGVATGYEGPDQRWRPAPESSVRAALRVMGVACDSPADINGSLAEAEEAPWRRPVPACTVLRASRPLRLPVRVPPDEAVEVVVRTEGGEAHRVGGTPRFTGRARRLGDGAERLEAVVDLPADLPLGYHRAGVRVGGDDAVSGHVIVVPDRCPDPEPLGRSWGWMLQLYALRSERSWGLGDLADLRELLRWSAGLGADFAVVNPLHAASPRHPTEPSPYYPSSRRFANPLYLAVDGVPEVRELDGEPARQVAELAARARALNDADLIDRDAALAAKHEALGIAFARMPPARAQALARFRDERASDGLEEFATFCALAERHGVPFQTWPERLRHPSAPDVAAFREGVGAERVAYHCWLQMLCDEQLAGTQRAAVDAGARLGAVHDLAVGVDKGGADAWALQEALGLGVSVGAPPDAFNQQGQDWQQPPLLPNRLREQGYRPLAETLRAVLRHAGGIRIDHVIGLFRLFWIPDGEVAKAGTYVRYPAEDLLGVLALEAHRAGAVVIGEDLGTVERGVREALAERSVLTSSVLYFERDDADGERLRPADAYPRTAMASVTTHDLPTAAGWWTDEEVALRSRLDLLDDDSSEEAERAAKARERDRMERLLAEEGLLDPARATLPDRVAAMHAFLARTPALLVAANLGDAVCDLRQPNMPGTVDEYPNWRLPLAEPTDGGHRQVTLEDLREHSGAQRVIAALRVAGRGC